MKVYQTLAIAISISAAAVTSAYGQSECAALQGADRAKLIEYVQKKYKTPASMKIEIGDVSLVGSSCYRKLVFQAAGGAGPFRLELFATPDLRFLTKELLDVALDPAVEERQKAEALSAGLTRANFPARGAKEAPVTIAVFSDFQCPYCERFAATMKAAEPADEEKVRLIFHSFPLPMHPWARAAAEAAECAHQQGDSYFWALHDFMFAHQKDLSRDNLLSELSHAAKGLAGFDQGKFASCVVERKTAAEIDAEVAFAQQNGVNATPTAFFNGRKIQLTTPEQLHTLIVQLSNERKIAQAAQACEGAACERPKQ